jgi:hypothetical protein
VLALLGMILTLERGWRQRLLVLWQAILLPLWVRVDKRRGTVLEVLLLWLG